MKTMFLAGTAAIALMTLVAPAQAQLVSTNRNLNTELSLSSAQRLAGADKAHARGTTGRGQTVAVIDSGVRATHQELSGKIVGGWNYLTRSANVADANGHGTHVASIVAGRKDGLGTFGIAPDANIMPFVVAGANGAVVGGANNANIADAMRRASAAGVRIINNSYGGATYAASFNRSIMQALGGDMIAAAMQVNRAGGINVWATGNNGAANPSWQAALPVTHTELRGSWVAVTAVAANKNIASYANRCGVAMNWCLAAPGTAVTAASIRADNQYTSMTGTSMAAPAVSGALALIMQLWPHLTNAQALNILFNTADDLGAKGIDPIFGHGLLNVDRGTAPVGTLQLAMTTRTSTGTVSAAASGFAPSSVVSASRLKSVDQDVMVMDEYERGYAVGFGAFVGEKQRATPDLGQRYRAFRDGRAPIEIETRDGIFAFSFRENEVGKAGDTDIEAATWGAKMRFSGGEVSFASNPDHGLGFQAKAAAADVWADRKAMAMPHFSFVSGGSSTAVTLGGQSLAFRFESFGGGVENSQGTKLKDASVSGFAGGVSVGVGSGRIGFNVGSMTEDGSILGSAGFGAFGEGIQSTTRFAGVSVEAPVTRTFALFGSGSMGMTEIKGDGLLTGGQLTTTGFAVGAVAKEVFRSNDNLSFGVSQPLRAESGTLKFNVPVARDVDGNVTRANFTANAGAEARQLDLQAAWSTQLQDGALVRLGVVHSLNAGNEKNAAETTLMATYRLKF
jgi:subtilase-type serine protease